MGSCLDIVIKHSVYVHNTSSCTRACIDTDHSSTASFSEYYVGTWDLNAECNII